MTPVLRFVSLFLLEKIVYGNAQKITQQISYIYIYENIFITTWSYRYQWFRVSTLQANAHKPFILSKNMKRTTGGGHLEITFSRWPPPEVRFMFDNMNGLWAVAPHHCVEYSRWRILTSATYTLYIYILYKYKNNYMFMASNVCWLSVYTYR